MRESTNPLTSIPAKKHLGQHFLTDANMIAKIVDCLGPRPEDYILEIGAGTGALTERLAASGAKVYALDLDPRSIDVLEERKAKEGWTNVQVIQGDILRTSIPDLVEGLPAHGLRVLGNLPYSLTSPILFTLMDNAEWISDAVLMMQKEVAHRILSPPGSRDYGILSILTRIHSQPRLAFHVSPGVFVPRPKVWSSVAIFEFLPSPLIHTQFLGSFRTLVKTAFNQRRKILSNALRPLLGNRELPASVAGRRAEELSVDDFLILWRFLNLDPS